MPSGPYRQHLLGAHSLKSLQRNRVAREKKENKAGSQEPWVQVLTLPLVWESRQMTSLGLLFSQISPHGEEEEGLVTWNQRVES